MCIKQIVRWSIEALTFVLKTPWHVIGGLAGGGAAASAASSASAAAGGWGESIDLTRHVLPPEHVTVHSWCKGNV